MPPRMVAQTGYRSVPSSLSAYTSGYVGRKRCESIALDKAVQCPRLSPYDSFLGCMVPDDGYSGSLIR